MMRQVSTCARALLAAVLLAMAAVTLGTAQTRDGATQESAATQDDAASQRRLGEALVFGLGDVGQDVASGRRLLEAAAAAGDARAKASLGKILLEGYYLPAEPDRALTLLQDAAAAGVVQAQITLGLALLWGGPVEADPERARVLLGQAAQAGDTQALRILGEQLVGGWVFDRDAAEGSAMLEAAVAKGDPEAQVALGSFLLYGTGLPPDLARALELFESAAAAGNAEGLELYGEWLMWSQTRPAAAETFLRRAGDMGRGSAWVVLAEGAMYGYLPPRSRAKFDGYAEKARAAGQERIAVLEAERRMWGISMRASGPKTVALLEKAAENGNATALKYLIGLVRDGNHVNIRKRPVHARDYLARFGALLTPLEIAQFSTTIEAAKANDIGAYARVAEELERQPELISAWFAKELYRANPNVAVYLLQADMRRRGLYGGPLNGLATRSTLRALWRACMTLDDSVPCRDGVMHPDVIGALLAR